MVVDRVWRAGVPLARGTCPPLVQCGPPPVAIEVESEPRQRTLQVMVGVRRAMMQVVQKGGLPRLHDRAQSSRACRRVTGFGCDPGVAGGQP